MRIIAGEFRSRKLFSPKGLQTRPMLDRMKEAVFSMLDDALHHANVLDVFAGTGNLGLEALSRGAQHVTFIEKAQPVLEVLQRNIELLQVQNRVKVVRQDALRWRIEPRHGFDLIFYDPPYELLRKSLKSRQAVIAPFVDLLMNAGKQHAQGIMHYPRNLLSAADFTNIPKFAIRNYGTNSVVMARK